MSKNLKFIIWILAVAIFSAVIGSLLPSKPMPDTSKQVMRGRGSTVQTVQNTTKPVASVKPVDAQITAPSDPASSNGTQISAPAPAPQAAPAANGASPAAPVSTGRNGAPKVPASAATFYQLKEILDKEPGTVSRVVFQNGSNQVIANRVGKSDLKVIVPDDGGKAELRRKLDELKISYEVKAAEEEGMGTGLKIAIAVAIFVIGSILFTQWSRRREAQANGTTVGGKGPGGPNSGNPGSNFGSTTAKMVEDLGDGVPKVKFSDVAGCDEAVKELRRIVTVTSNHVIYNVFDAKLPRGVLLLGPPGTGKTLLAKAVAGECDGSMQILSGSDFVEMFVGVGAARVRDTFAKARAKVKETGKLSVIFIDEIDAVGGKRSNNANSNSEREQTLNALLVEMDGVQANKGIIIIAATNRVDMLDEALLRPGRFSSHVAVDMPDKNGREKIFAIHTRKKPLADNVTPAILAVRSFGYSGAEIENACDRAALIAAERWAEQPGAAEVLAKWNEAEKLLAESKKERADAATARLDDSGRLKAERAAALKAEADAMGDKLSKREIFLADFDEGIDFVRYGGPKTSSQASMAEEEKANTAVHEGGHGCSAAVLKGSDPVVKATIMRRSRALGYVQYMPTSDRLSFTDEQAVARIITAMAGRAAQKIYLKRVDTGASNDFEQACDMARKMVTSWGMSRLGHISVGDRGAAPMAGMGGGGHMSYGGNLQNEIDAEWRRIVAECDKIAHYIVETDKERMEHVTKTLLEQETILAPQWLEILAKFPSKVDPEKIRFNPAA